MFWVMGWKSRLVWPPNDLPIGAIADMIEINLREALGEKDLPDLPQPKDYLLM
jgi:ion channel-forming bestrophin family protein